ncbi:DsbA family protein [Paenibacillus sp. YIM B09110]|uniref:DsbA family protein n=1 Tax=Paenibacillus sp. YIM B09110 TaxID=3126102 RepID=UPI00301D7823
MSVKVKLKSNSTVSTKKSNPAKVPVMFTTIIVALFVIIYFISHANSGQKEAERFANPPSIVDQPIIGSEQAEVTMIEFGDYKCPSCKLWSEKIYPQLKEKYMDSGLVKLAFINTLFHGEESTLGALAGEAVLLQNKDAFWEFNEAMFAAQPTSEHNTTWITIEEIAKIAQSIPTKIDIAKLINDVTNRSTSSQVDTDTGIVTKYQINETPALLINGIKVSNPFDLNEIKKLIDTEIGGVQNE